MNIGIFIYLPLSVEKVRLLWSAVVLLGFSVLYRKTRTCLVDLLKLFLEFLINLFNQQSKICWEYSPMKLTIISTVFGAVWNSCSTGRVLFYNRTENPTNATSVKCLIPTEQDISYNIACWHGNEIDSPKQWNVDVRKYLLLLFKCPK